MGKLKEYGVWDTVLLPGTWRRHSNYSERLKAATSWNLTTSNLRERVGDVVRRSELSAAVKLMENPSLYPDYFINLAQSRPGVTLVGDITPSYALLGAEQLQTVKRAMEVAGFVVKPVFILRDPVTRMESAYRMMLRRRPLAGPPKRETPPSLLNFAMREHNRERGNYLRTVNALDKAFGKDNVFYGQYETFFTTTEIGRLLSFLELTWLDPNLAHRINESGNMSENPTNELAELREILSPIYEFCYRRFPKWDFQQWN